MNFLAKISIIGSGIVGTIVGKGFDKIEYDVIFYDISKERIEQLKKEGFDATTNMDYAISNSGVSFISVPTPTVNNKIDLSIMKSATEEMAKSLKNKKDYHLFIVKSTVVPNTTEDVIKPILEKFSGKKCGPDFGLCMNPEFLTEIHKSWTNDPSQVRDFFTEDRIVIGSFDKKSGDTLEKLYKKLKIPIFRTNLKTAELIKYASNCCLASRVSYWNEIFYVCNRLGVDSNLVAEIVSMDKRVGKYGTIHGMAYGGKCFPKDVKAFIAFAESIDHDPIFMKSVDKINEQIKKDKGVRE
jgi:UDPglucose 6-dehydrogenase